MSEALYPTGQLRFWNETEINLRELLVSRFRFTMEDTLTSINKVWKFKRVEGPLLTPKEFISSAYSSEDLWMTNGLIGGQEVGMRAETTASSYLYARHLMGQAGGNHKPPICVWQSGKSFRRESNEGGSAAKLRFFEFYQLEFQCIYSITTGADYLTPTLAAIESLIGVVTSCQTRIIPSDRLPAYSTKTMDVEILQDGVNWREMCSVSLRKDFSAEHIVLEVAVGLDRLVSVSKL